MMARKTNSVNTTAKREEPDRFVERGSRALAKHLRRQQHLSIMKWITVFAFVLLSVGVSGYFLSPQLDRLPWQNYLNRLDFDFRASNSKAAASDDSELPRP